jgi:DNA-binding PadR family transcriptional regulator
VENIRPVLEDLEREGLIRIRQVAGSGMEVIELTPKGRDAARHAGGP